MSLDEQFADVKSKARSIYDRVSALAGIEKGYRRQSENGVRVALEQSVRGIQATFQSLVSVQDLGPDDEDDLEGDETPEKIALKQSADWLNKAFSELARQSQKGLSRTSYIKRQSIELRGDVDRLSSDISNLRSDIERSKVDTNWRIAQRRSDNAEAEASMANYQAMINDLEEELEGKKDNRALLRVGRMAAWGTALLFPPPALVAGGLELGAHSGLGKRVREYKEYKQRCVNQYTNIQGDINSLQSDISNLNSTLNDINQLAQSCEKYETWCKDEKNHSARAENQYRRLDKVANDLVRWGNTLQNPTELMKTITDDARALREKTRTLVQQVMKGGQTDLKEICKPLTKLLKEWE